MDTDNYTKMCGLAHEIQKDHIWHTGDIIGTGEKQVWIRYMYCDQTEDCKRVSELDVKLKPSIWLPTQEQLQHMVYSEEAGSRNIPSFLIELLHYSFNHQIGIFVGQSWEILWLAFVMYTKYKKIWDGNDWVTTKK